MIISSSLTVFWYEDLGERTGFKSSAQTEFTLTPLKWDEIWVLDFVNYLHLTRYNPIIDIRGAPSWLHGHWAVTPVRHPGAGVVPGQRWQALRFRNSFRRKATPVVRSSASDKRSLLSEGHGHGCLFVETSTSVTTRWRTWLPLQPPWRPSTDEKDCCKSFRRTLPHVHHYTPLCCSTRLWPVLSVWKT